MRLIFRRRVLGLALIALAFVPGVLYCLLWSDPHHTRILDQPIVLRRGEVRSPAFTAQVDGGYLLLLGFQQPVDARRMECLLGVQDGGCEKCRDGPCVLDVSWAVSKKGRIIASDTSGHWWRQQGLGMQFFRTPGRTFRAVGRFEARRGERYALSMDFDDDPGELNITKPSVVIMPASFLRPSDSGFLLGFLAFIWAGALPLAALVVVTKREAAGLAAGGGAGPAG